MSNGNISLGNLPLFDNKKNSKGENIDNKRSRERKTRDNVRKKVKKKISNNNGSDLFKFNMNDINRGMKMMDLSDEDLERGMEIITRTKKYMSPEERKILIKVESLLDLVKGIKKLSSIDFDDYEETNFFSTMDEVDKKNSKGENIENKRSRERKTRDNIRKKVKKKISNNNGSDLNMMIKEILEVFPEKRRESLDKAIDLKKKIDLFAELFLPDDFGDGGFSLSSLVNINNLGSMNNLKLLGSLLRTDDDKKYEEYDYDDEEYEEYEEYDDEEYYDEYDDYEDEYEEDDE